jgi:phage terminase large subunit-like protein
VTVAAKRKQKRERTICPTHDIGAEWYRILKLLPGYNCFHDADAFYFDEAAADFVCNFFETRLHHVEGGPEIVGTLVVLEDWQRAFLGALFGWKQKADGQRRYKKALLYIPRKNSKTTMCAGITLLMLLCENEGGQQIFFGAATSEQAAMAKNIAEKMIGYDDDMTRELKPLRMSIHTKDKQHFCRILSKTPSGKHGRNANLALMDELHEHPNSDLSDSITSSMGARNQPLTIFTTTADFVRPSFCNETYEYACGVRDGLFINHSYLPVIYAAEDTDDWTDRKLWRRVNPNLGVSVNMEFLESEFAEAQRVPSKRNTFKRLYLNMRTQSNIHWLDIQRWDKCSGLAPGETPQAWRARMLNELKGQRAWAGLDLGSVSDLTSLALLFEGDSVGYPESLIAIPYFWFPKGAIDEIGDMNKELYTQWAEADMLAMTAGDVMDYAVIPAALSSLRAKFRIPEIAADTAFQGNQLSIQLHNDYDIVTEVFAQHFGNYDTPTKDLEMRTRNQTIIHGANPVLRWMASHAMVAEDMHGRIKPVKEAKNSSKKIDGIAALTMALGRWHMREKDSKQSRYNDPGRTLMTL